MNCIVHEVAKRWTGLSGFHFHLHIITFHFAQPLGALFLFLERMLMDS